MDQAADAILQAAREEASLDELSDVDVDGDGSSSLSEIEYKDSHQDDDGEASDDNSNNSEDENDSEAETERLEESPNKIRAQKDVVLSSHNDNQTYERSPSKLHNQIIPDGLGDEEDDDPLSEDEVSVIESPKSSVHDEADPEPPTAATSLEDSAGEGKRTLSASDADTRKRKRSIMAGSGLDEELEEPLRKRTGSVLTQGDDYAIDDEDQPEEEGGNSNPISGDISADDRGEEQDDEVAEELEEAIVAVEEATETVNIPVSPKKRGRRKRKGTENGVSNQDEDPENTVEENTVLNGEEEVKNGDEDNAENEADDEAEAALKNEEELEKKRIAAEQLSAIEKQFSMFRDRLYDERLEQLNREEAMLREDKPTHPEYLEMMKCIDARRDEKLRISEKLREYELKALKTYAVARRSQILVQYQQDVRDIRERKLELLGKQWYEIQHDRRSYAGSVPDYTMKFPTRRSQQMHNQVAYSTEVSILSGVAKYVGFPAAPPMATATESELADDLAKMGRSRHPLPIQPSSIPLQELAALRTAGSTSRFKPAEEQFIEQTPWANPQHPSHAHLLLRQTSAQQTPRTSSPFSQSQPQPRRHSHQLGSGAPISGTFQATSSSLSQHSNGLSGGRISPHNPFSNSTHSHTVAPSPLGSRQPSLSPQQNRQPLGLSDGPKQNGMQQSPTAVDLW